MSSRTVMTGLSIPIDTTTVHKYRVDPSHCHKLLNIEFLLPPDNFVIISIFFTFCAFVLLVRFALLTQLRMFEDIKASYVSSTLHMAGLFRIHNPINVTVCSRYCELYHYCLIYNSETAWQRTVFLSFESTTVTPWTEQEHMTRTRLCLKLLAACSNIVILSLKDWIYRVAIRAVLSSGSEFYPVCGNNFCCWLPAIKNRLLHRIPHVQHPDSRWHWRS